MNPNVESARQKREQAALIEQTAASIRSQNTGSDDAAVNLEIEAQTLRQQADQEELDAATQAEREKAEIDLKYGTG